MIVNPHPWTYSRSFATSVLSLGLVCIVAPSPGSHQVMGVLRQNQRFIQLFYTVGARLLTSYKILSEVAAHSCKVDMSISCLWVSCVTTRKLEQAKRRRVTPHRQGKAWMPLSYVGFPETGEILRPWHPDTPDCSISIKYVSTRLITICQQKLSEKGRRLEATIKRFAKLQVDH